MTDLEKDKSKDNEFIRKDIQDKLSRIIEQNDRIVGLVASIAALNQEQNMLIARLIQISDYELSNLVSKEEYKAISSKLDSVGRISGRLLEELCSSIKSSKS